MKKSILTFAIISLFIISCSKERTYIIREDNNCKIITNFGIPNEPDLQVELKEITSIQGYNDAINPNENSFFYITKIQVSPEGSIFLMEKYSHEILKYSSEGKFLSKFSGKGKGPGEVLTELCKHYILNEKIVVSERSFLHHFDFDGNFIERKNVEDVGIFVDFKNLKNDEFLSTVIRVDKRGDDFLNDSYFVQTIEKSNFENENLGIIDDKIEKCILDVLSNDIPEGFIFRFSAAVSSSEIFVLKRTKTNYSINCYNFNLQKQKVIKMQFTPTKYSKEEYKLIQEDYPEQSDFCETIFDTKLSLNNLHYDNLNGFLIGEHTPDLNSRTIIFDIFEDGIYLNSFVFPIDHDDYNPMNQGFQFLFQDGKLYHYSKTRNKITVFEINYNLR